MNNACAPVAVFAYNRLDKLKNCIKSLEKCDLSLSTELHVFADGFKSEVDKSAVENVHAWIREYADNEKSVTGTPHFKDINIYIREENAGLANSIIAGVSEIINVYGKIIVLEDDLVVSRGFLSYMNESLSYYEDEPFIWSIASYGNALKSLRRYNHDVYLLYLASSWGWATWKDRWNTVDWTVHEYEDVHSRGIIRKKLSRSGGRYYPMLQMQMNGEIDSWAIRWNCSAAMQDRMTIYPKVGYTTNDGYDGSGTHTIGTAPRNTFSNDNNTVLERVFPENRIIYEYCRANTDTLMKKIKRNANLKGIRKLIRRYMRIEIKGR